MNKISRYFFLLIVPFSVYTSCNKKNSSLPPIEEAVHSRSIRYAEGFDIQEFDDYTLLIVSQAFPESNKIFKYALVPAQKNNNHIASKTNDSLSTLLKNKKIDALIHVPLQSVVLTSTTHIPSLEMLGTSETLTGFPNLDYISSPLSRKRISEGEIRELGHNESINTEVTIDLNPDVLIGFGVEGENKSFESIRRAGIPILYNGDWVEKDPLGKAEWIKFFGALYGKERAADSIFRHIEKEYLDAKEIVSQLQLKPTILAGAMYKDVWYLPQGQSWQAQVIKDAGGNYLWSDSEGTGSIALSVESVLEKAQNAQVWIAPGQFTSYSNLIKSNTVYAQFDAFKTKKAFTFASIKGETGGVLYYELAPNRPDLVLKDLIYALHPELIPEYQSHFFTPLEE